MKGYEIKTGYSKMDVDCIHQYVSRESYWAKGMPLELLKTALRNSYCVGAFTAEGKQIAFARVVSDRATFAYLADVFVLEEYRGQGVSKEIMGHIMKVKWIGTVRRFLLATKDAHSLYTQFGFTTIANPGNFMNIHRPGMYENQQQPE